MEVCLISSIPDIQIPNIEQELNLLWNIKKESSIPQHAKPSKACLFTLILYAREERRANYLQELIDTILDKFPCRIIFIQGDKETATSYFHVKVSTVISGQSSGAKGAAVACDQILIEASQDQLFRAPYVVVPHIVPDLPVYLLWGQNPFEEKDIFPHLQPYASRVIFDSECADNLALFCEEMQASLDSLKMDIMDINWALASNWRDMLIQLFDTPEKFQQLNDCKSLIIQYNGKKTETMRHPEIRALYLQGWLACCLKWRYREAEKHEDSVVISYFGAIHPVVVALTAQDIPDQPPGAIMSIEIATATGHSYYASRKGNLPQVLIHASAKETCELPFTLPLPNVYRGLNFMREIFFSKLGEHYREMLTIISKLDFKIFYKA